jgi:hypothetical protein
VNLNEGSKKWYTMVHGNHSRAGKDVSAVELNSKKNRSLLGLGLDNDDGHVRVTRGRNFHLVGGSEETHESMQEKCIKFNEKLSQRGKELEDLESKEFHDLADECRMNVVPQRPDDKKE